MRQLQNLEGTNLKGAKPPIREANRKANLGTNPKGANLEGADLKGANLEGAKNQPGRDQPHGANLKAST